MITFTAADDARRALRALRRLHDAGDVRLGAAAVVGRRTDGRAFALEQRHARAAAGDDPGSAPAVADLLSGPFGLVLDNAPDALVGSLVDIADAGRADRLLHTFGAAMPAGHIATIALVSEARQGTIDAVASRLDGILRRRARADVEAEIADGASRGGRFRKVRERFSRRH